MTRADEHELQADEPGAPPGFLLDRDDERTGSHDDDTTGCAEVVSDELRDDDGDSLARGEGEVD